MVIFYQLYTPYVLAMKRNDLFARSTELNMYRTAIDLEEDNLLEGNVGDPVVQWRPYVYVVLSLVCPEISSFFVSRTVR